MQQIKDSAKIFAKILWTYCVKTNLLKSIMKTEILVRDFSMLCLCQYTRQSK